MPSGSKKRKAAKRKKAIQATNHVNGDNSQGNVDIENQDERESDGSELSSPASLGHGTHHHSFKDDSTGSEKNDPSTCTAIMADSKYMEQVAPESDNAFQLERELKSEDVDSNNLKVELIQSEKYSHSENDSGSGTSNSDDESRVCQTKQEEPNALADDLVAAASVDVLVTPDVATSVEPIVVIENNLAKNTAVSDAFQSASRCDDDKLLPANDDALVGLMESMQQEFIESKARALPINNENVEKSLVAGETSNGDKDVKHPRVPESSENQPLLGSAAPAPMTERSSWLSCCGLLDVITVSNK